LVSYFIHLGTDTAEAQSDGDARETFIESENRRAMMHRDGGD
jgi:hypothetical protein